MFEASRKNIIKYLIKIFECKSDYYFSLHSRFKKFDAITVEKYYNYYSDLNKDYGIIMQGPIVLDDDFTFNTLKLYRYLYPHINLVLSTWENTPVTRLQKFEEIGVAIILNKIPKYKGVVNINLQLITTKAGIRYLEQQGCKYILKVRTDQRINKNIDFLSGMRNLQKYFPVENEKIYEKLIIINANTFKARFYGITDMLMFGNINDMISYWCIPLEKKEEVKMGFDDPDFYIKNKVGEGFLVQTFFNFTRFNPKWTYPDSEYFIKKYFIIIDKEQLDFFWFKYERFFENINYHKKEVYRSWETINFLDYINYK